MPYDHYKKLDLGDTLLLPLLYKWPIKLLKNHIGMIEDVRLRIDRHVIPTDFIILDMPHDDKISIILGRPFLSTVGASVDRTSGKIVFNIYNNPIIRHF